MGIGGASYGTERHVWQASWQRWATGPPDEVAWRHQGRSRKEAREHVVGLSRSAARGCPSGPGRQCLRRALRNRHASRRALALVFRAQASDRSPTDEEDPRHRRHRGRGTRRSSSRHARLRALAQGAGEVEVHVDRTVDARHGSVGAVLPHHVAKVRGRRQGAVLGHP